MNTLLLAAMWIDAAAGLAYLFIQTAVLPLINLLLFVAFLGLWLMARRGYVILAAHLLLGLFWAYLTFGLFISGGIGHYIVYSFMVLALAAFILLESKGTLHIIILSVMSVSAAAAAELAGLLPAPIVPTNIYHSWIAFFANFSGALILMWITKRNVISALRRERRESEERRQTEAVLRETAQKLDDLVSSSPIGIHTYLLQPDGRLILTSANPAASKILGFSYEDRLGMTIEEAFPDDIQTDIPELYREVCRTGKAWSAENITYSGEEISGSFEFHAFPTGPNTMASMFIDISDRVRLEADRRRSESSLHVLGNAIDDPAMMLDINGDILFINETMSAQIGQPAEKLIGKNAFDFTPDEIRQDRRERLKQVFATKQPQLFETRIEDRDFTTKIYPVLDDDGEVTCVAIISFDLTQQKIIRRELKKTNEKLSLLFESVNDGITVTDLQGTVVDVNETGVRLMGYERKDEIIGRSALEFIAGEENRQKALKGMRWTLTTGKSGLIEYRLRRKSGELIDCELNAVLLKDSKGAPQSFVAIIRDVSERKQAEKRNQAQLQRLSALRSIDLMISNSRDLQQTMAVFMDHVMAQLLVDAAQIRLYDPLLQTLKFSAGRGSISRSRSNGQVRLGEGYIGRAALEQRIILLPDVSGMDSSDPCIQTLRAEGFRSCIFAPLLAKGQVKGVLELFSYEPLNPDQEWLDFLENLAAQAAIAIDNMALFQSLQRSNFDLSLAYDTTLEGWSRALELRDQETEGHTQRVTELTLHLARALGLPEEQMVHLRRGAILHDIGKMGIPDKILLKPGPLSKEERDVIEKHPLYAYQMLSRITYLRPALDIPYCHHEKWDGSGYPRGLKGEQIPLGARIFTVVDVWDALTTDRPYSPAWSKEKAMEYLRAESGKHFDPVAVDELIKILSDEGKTTETE